MKHIQKGIDEGSKIFFNSPSKIARELLYYPISSGISYCNKDLLTVREKYDSCLITLVLDGEFVLEQDGVYKAHKNEILLVDCYRKHKYYTTTNAITYWVHFMGSNSKELFNQIIKDYGHHIISESLKEEMVELLNSIEAKENQTRISEKIYSILMLLFKGNEKTVNDQTLKYIHEAKDYIKKNFEKQITIKDIAQAINISPSYLFNIYKKHQSISPYDYLLHCRLKKAKELLRQSDLSISDIAFAIGFNSIANFIYFFKKEVGISPLQFRKMPF